MNQFQQFMKINSKFKCLDPKHYEDEDSLELIKFFSEQYPIDIITLDDVVQEFPSFRILFKETDTEELNINNVLKFLLTNNLCDLYPNITTLYKIYITLPILSPSAERSFSRLKLLKSYLRSTMSEERFSALALLTTERDLVNDLDLEVVLNGLPR
ncbi:52 kDa repressor of the inhibitor of the protein kinase-like [Hydra vulgaris]|uniref:52 kDa repressor of the inhibitor of the protein kinase-like n=1 Tax=Hydra vulgaris TaxID=6087 RepID=UPI001F5F9065|nr:52 kDa repressor of the inhibitor of the protein kinase-like [Hydra vulgaris]